MLYDLGKNYQKKMWVLWVFCGFGGFFVGSVGFCGFGGFLWVLSNKY